MAPSGSGASGSREWGPAAAFSNVQCGIRGACYTGVTHRWFEQFTDTYHADLASDKQLFNDRVLIRLESTFMNIESTMNFPAKRDFGTTVAFLVCVAVVIGFGAFEFATEGVSGGAAIVVGVVVLLTVLLWGWFWLGTSYEIHHDAAAFWNRGELTITPGQTMVYSFIDGDTMTAYPESGERGTGKIVVLKRSPRTAETSITSSGEVLFRFKDE